ncbi:hypothetical protein SADUNF_Sadunf17G0043100 [Salix dunnii]|uniref:Uncharacterized protein n=1 Tax=Salix dunnii TaxID=1413687 RepID=A0A835J4H3_9ROSI|nr:hypothetical protein SADUNF_Sadunf17G0043100 [Salix dunnii]
MRHDTSNNKMIAGNCDIPGLFFGLIYRDYIHFLAGIGEEEGSSGCITNRMPEPISLYKCVWVQAMLTRTITRPVNGPSISPPVSPSPINPSLLQPPALSPPTQNLLDTSNEQCPFFTLLDLCLDTNEGLVVAGGGERNGMEGSVVGIGIVGIEGMLESGGKVTFGTAGIVGIVGRLGSGGEVTFGTAGIVGIVGRLGSGGKVGLGSEG